MQGCKCMYYLRHSFIHIHISGFLICVYPVMEGGRYSENRDRGEPYCGELNYGELYYGLCMYIHIYSYLLSGKSAFSMICNHVIRAH